MRIDDHKELHEFVQLHPSFSIAFQRFLDHVDAPTLPKLLALTPPGAALAVEAMREAQYQPASIQVACSSARVFFRRLVAKGLVPSNPLSEIRVKGGQNIPVWNVLQASEIEKLVEAPTGRHRLRDRAVILALVEHGFRASELCAIRWEQVIKEPDGRLVATVLGKGKKEARMRLKPRTVEAALAWSKSTRSSRPFIPMELDGTPLDRFEVHAIITTWAKSIGSKVTPHGVRATFISDVISRKGIETARKLARHASIGTTVRYSRWEVLDDE